MARNVEAAARRVRSSLVAGPDREARRQAAAARIEARGGRPRMAPWRMALRHLYEGESWQARRFRYGLLVFDLFTVLFVIASSFVWQSPAIIMADLVLGGIALAEFVARLSANRRPWRELTRPSSIADLIAIASFLLPAFSGGYGFLRALRTLRLLRTYRILRRLRADSAFFRAHEEVVFAATNLGVFVFVMTGLVWETQHRTNPHINDYADSLYFTITTLTTTGFGDITLPGTTGRLLSVVIMLCGVTLFLRLAQTLFRPNKVRFPCPSCGLQRHEPDAVHCKACGVVLCIPDEGGG